MNEEIVQNNGQGTGWCGIFNCCFRKQEEIEGVALRSELNNDKLNNYNNFNDKFENKINKKNNKNNINFINNLNHENLENSNNNNNLNENKEYNNNNINNELNNNFSKEENKDNNTKVKLSTNENQDLNSAFKPENIANINIFNPNENKEYNNNNINNELNNNNLNENKEYNNINDELNTNVKKEEIIIDSKINENIEENKNENKDLNNNNLEEKENNNIIFNFDAISLEKKTDNKDINNNLENNLNESKEHNNNDGIRFRFPITNDIDEKEKELEYDKEKNIDIDIDKKKTGDKNSEMSNNSSNSSHTGNSGKESGDDFFIKEDGTQYSLDVDKNSISINKDQKQISFKLQFEKRSSKGGAPRYKYYNIVLEDLPKDKGKMKVTYDVVEGNNIKEDSNKQKRKEKNHTIEVGQKNIKVYFNTIMTDLKNNSDRRKNILSMIKDNFSSLKLEGTANIMKEVQQLCDSALKKINTRTGTNKEINIDNNERRRKRNEIKTEIKKIDSGFSLICGACSAEGGSKKKQERMGRGSSNNNKTKNNKKCEIKKENKDYKGSETSNNSDKTDNSKKVSGDDFFIKEDGMQYSMDAGSVLVGTSPQCILFTLTFTKRQGQIGKSMTKSYKILFNCKDKDKWTVKTQELDDNNSIKKGDDERKSINVYDEDVKNCLNKIINNSKTDGEIDQQHKKEILKTIKKHFGVLGLDKTQDIMNVVPGLCDYFTMTGIIHGTNENDKGVNSNAKREKNNDKKEEEDKDNKKSKNGIVLENKEEEKKQENNIDNDKKGNSYKNNINNINIITNIKEKESENKNKNSININDELNTNVKKEENNSNNLNESKESNNKDTNKYNNIDNNKSHESSNEMMKYRFNISDQEEINNNEVDENNNLNAKKKEMKK